MVEVLLQSGNWLGRSNHFWTDL